jgi:hypothetical protein
MAEEDNSQQIKNTLKEWISLDDQERQLREQIKDLKSKKTINSVKILEFMRDNQVDNFALEGSGVGNISRSVRTSRPPLRRSLIRTQLLLQFSDQPQRVSEVLRAIEGISEGAEDMSVGGNQKELLIRRLPREKKVIGITM